MIDVTWGRWFMYRWPNTRWRIAVWWRWHERLQRHQWGSHQVSESMFAHRWDLTRAHGFTHEHKHTHAESYTVNRKQTSRQTLINLFLLLYSVLPSCLSSRALSCLHIQTHSHSGGVIECDSKSWEGCWRVIRLTCEMEPTWHQQVGSDTYSRHGWITPAKTGG